ncbi:G-type lectin S-receptor-like serine/threonine-protein kinase At4g03230 isoform X1 [Coffea eugenioides]|uniref:G-type lectin S-receptor-like serine/threonine-protein kinase At4g03230 isoform X1 n=2 Tax=Coffea eugenioides TaxID=49369 RepID=UPI000F613D93|nr:G-type lectin S-receptor-like serine/threonine-protein kinase At4g03230 isoform X1 [Coffea eugenioides]XP_027159124.1 G-type lectin S-receptor-like serine/threonine-protein kinase At4g03230 isoform X1 [Coffea eugenioides]
MQPAGISLSFLLLVVLETSNFQSCVARDTITFYSLLPDDGTTIISAGKRFELGFFNPEDNINTGRYIGIWYYNLSPRTVVWIANRDEPLPYVSGSFAIVEDGNLKLLDEKGSSYFQTNLESSSPVNRTLKLLDSGNLALIDGTSGNILWQSFAEPTDTFLPGMKMDEGLKLVSWKDIGNPGTGNFTFQRDQENGLPKIMKGKIAPHWKSDQSGSVELPYSVAFFLSNFSRSVNQATYKSSSAYPSINPGKGLRNPSTFANTRLLMNSSGEIQFYSREQDGWSLMWKEPHDACSIYNHCGNYGSCNLKSGGLNCDCLPGFKPVFPDVWNTGDFSGGCERKLAICNKPPKPDRFLNLKLMKVRKPDILLAADREDTCRQENCLSDCACQAYYYAAFDIRSRNNSGGSSCLIWTSELTNLQEECVDGGHNLSIRIPVSAIETTSSDCQTCGKNIVPYPLATGPNCGDPSYRSFTCDESTGQLFFSTSDNRYEVININKDDRRFVIQVNSLRAENCAARTSVGRVLQLNPSLPFSVSNWCYNESLTFSDRPSVQHEQGIQISWDPPLEPICSSPNECQHWPDSSCAATAIHDQTRCLCNSNYKWDNLALKCISEILANTNQSEGTRSKSENPSISVNRVTVIIVTTVVAVVLLAATLTCSFYRRIIAKRKETEKSIPGNPMPYLDDSERQAAELVDEDDQIVDVPYFSLESILAATNNFSDKNKLGRGGFGPVYKGIFPGEKEIAVKRLSSHSGQGMEEFRNEVVLIAKLQHRNLVRLLGYCIKGPEKILLYEYMPNKSLDTFIFDEGRCIVLDWNMRFNIILGIARGLLYLHQDSRLRIIHRDLKTSNILLDEEMNPKISDFGLARIVQGKETEANTIKVVGTYGYMSPEYAIEGLFSVKSDVFSFGVIILEIVSGKRNTSGFYRSEEALSLLGYAWRLWQERKALDLVDKRLLESCNGTEVMKSINIGLLCVQDDPSDRPTMSNVLIMLSSETTTLPSPNQPAFVGRKRTSSTSASLSSKAETISINEMTISAEDGR